eukprot:NODE_5437_length_706_cov_4.821918_g4584_i0.p2 GENE.NODE_5437_length_706_cov_4.821918_g4584_i0~~NODE_5437_length_706_cov_4.821918_g4584_i0.p2  ORF type:complete len:50 (+),score=0.31 NODE_5437_length_706_cov_4.821918_g4584_i0:250-399(+)
MGLAGPAGPATFFPSEKTPQAVTFPPIFGRNSGLRPLAALARKLARPQP